MNHPSFSPAMTPQEACEALLDRCREWPEEHARELRESLRILCHALIGIHQTPDGAPELLSAHRSMLSATTLRIGELCAHHNCPEIADDFFRKISATKSKEMMTENHLSTSELMSMSRRIVGEIQTT